MQTGSDIGFLGTTRMTTGGPAALQGAPPGALHDPGALVLM
jgi:hypothetical protein